jgi:rRNA-processing protein FCF1
MMTMKNNPKNIVIDTTFLDAMYRLDIFDNLVMLYSKVFIPVEVEREFLSNKNSDRDSRFEYIIHIFYNNSGYDRFIIN